MTTTERRHSGRWAVVGLLSCILLSGLFLPAMADAALIDRIVARVNDEIITKHELEKAATPFMLQRGMNPGVLDNPDRRREIFKQVLDDLIERQLIIAEADKMNLTITDQQVDQWLSYQRSQQGMTKQQFQQVIDQYGMTTKEYREMVRQNLLKIRLVKVKLGRQISVSDDEVEEVYRARFGGSADTEKTVTLRHILFQPASDTPEERKKAKAKAREALAKLEKGADFKELAKEYGSGPSAQKGGLLGTFAQGELNPAFEDVAFKLGEGEHSGVVETEFGFHILRVDEISEREASGGADRKKAIRQQLRQQKMQNQLDDWVEKLRDKAFVDIHVDWANK